MTAKQSQNVRPGREAVVLSADQAAAVRAKEEAEKAPVADVRYEDLPVIHFPIRFKIKGREDFTGDVGGVSFVDGVSAGFHSYRRVMHIAAAFAPVIDAKTLIEISPLRERKMFMCANIGWHYGQALPEHCKDEAVTPVEVKEPPKPSEPVPVINTKTDELDPAKQARIMHAISRLRPGHKEDWTNDGRPDANRLADLITEKVFAHERDAAWADFNARMDADKNAFAVPNTDDVRKVLEGVGQFKGAVYLRQICRDRGLEEKRNRKDIIDVLIASGLTAEEAGKL
ncbi:MAG: hypothetical protein LPL29_08875 [Alphaproteobacteria bacterium]|nr:hypothetical protein [Alphaproteobacteria bacterium]